MARAFQGQPTAAAPAAPATPKPAPAKAAAPAAPAAPKKAAAKTPPAKPQSAAPAAPAPKAPSQPASKVWHATEGKYVSRPEPTRPESVESRAWYEAEADKAIKQRDDALLVPYLERLQNVARLQNERKIGEADLGAAAGPTAHTWLPSMQPMTTSARPGVFSDVRKGKPVTVWPTGIDPKTGELDRSKAAVPLTREELQTTKPADLATRALKTARQLSAAIDDHSRYAALIERRAKSREVSAAEMPKLAADARKRLENVLRLVAQMREYGWEGTNEELIETFAPAPPWE